MTSDSTKTGPSIAKHTSSSDVATPWLFICAIENAFGALHWDLAASRANRRVVKVDEKGYFSERDNALVQPWYELFGGKLLWLNPPYSDIAPWVEKCLKESIKGARIICLTPASVGTNWYRDYCFGQSHMIALNGRITFVGHKQGYPKDLMLSPFGFRPRVSYSVWNWKKDFFQNVEGLQINEIR